MKLLMLAPAPIQASHTSSAVSYETARLASLRRRDARLVNGERELDLLTHNAPLHERQDVSQEPSQVSSPDSPLEAVPRTFRRSFFRAHSAAPTTNVEVNDFTICVRQHHARLRKAARAAAVKSHRTFTVETPGGPTQFPHQRLLEGTLSLVCQTSLQALGVTLLIACDVDRLTTNPTSTRAVAGPDVEILR